MAHPFRIAFVGVDHPHGAGWRELLLNLGDEVEIAAIVPRYGGSLASLEERNAGAARFATVDDLLAGGQFDGAIVALPNNEGPEAVVKLARAGKHVLAEKPVARSAEEARPIIDAVREGGVAFQSGYTWRYDDGANRMRDMVADGRFGKVISLEMTFVTSDVTRRGPSHYLFDPQVSGVGYFNWLACHYLDLMTYVLEQSVVGITARTGVFGDTPIEMEDGGVALLDLSGGGLVTFIGGYWLPRWAGEAHWCLRGSKRWVHWDPNRQGTGGVLEIHGPKPQWHAMEETFVLPSDSTKGYGGRQGLALVRDWLDAARSGGRPCRNTPESLAGTLAIIDTILRASAEGRRIECKIG